MPDSLLALVLVVLMASSVFFVGISPTLDFAISVVVFICLLVRDKNDMSGVHIFWLALKMIGAAHTALPLWPWFLTPACSGQRTLGGIAGCIIAETHLLVKGC